MPDAPSAGMLKLISTASILLNVLLLLYPALKPHVSTRRLSEEQATVQAADVAQPAELSNNMSGTASTAALHDCASVSCPALFAESVPGIDTGDTYNPRRADPRQRAAPASMEAPTQAMYGSGARVGDLYRGYSNPFGKHASSSYRWTQLTAGILSQVQAIRSGRRIRFIVEVGSFAGGSAMVLGRFAVRTQGLQPWTSAVL